MALSGHSPFDHRVFHKEAKSLALAGHQVAIIGPWHRREIREGIEIIPIKPWTTRLGRVRTIFEAFCTTLKFKADIYHIHDPEMMPVLWLLKALTGKPVIADIHEHYPETVMARLWIPGIVRPVLKWLITGMERLNAKLVDVVIVATPSMLNLFPGAKRCLAIRNLPQITFGKTAEENEAPHIDYDIVHLGTMTPPRLEFLGQVAQELLALDCPFSWLFLGISPETQNWFHKQAPSKVSSLFTFKNQVPHEMVPYYLGRGRVGINYHAYEPRLMVAIPVKIFEYLCCGLPIVSSALPHVAEFMEQVDCGFLIRENSPALFAEAIATLVKDQALAKQKARRGYEAICREFNWEHESRKLLELYQNLQDSQGQERN